MYSAKNNQQIRSVAVLSLLSIFVFQNVYAAPNISGTSGTFNHGLSVTISGSGFGTKSSQNGAAPVAYSDMENNSTAARIGAWTDSNGYPDGILTTTTLNQRNPHSTRSATCNILGTTSNDQCSFEGGARSKYWFVQQWFYVDSNFSWATGPNANGNNKIFRLFGNSVGATPDLVIEGTPPAEPMFINIENTDEAHGGASSETAWGNGWFPTTGTHECIDEVFGHACETNPWNIYPSDVGWSSFPVDMGSSDQAVNYNLSQSGNYNITTPGWHLWQFEFKTSDGLSETVTYPPVDPGVGSGPGQTGNGTGILRWWADGRKVFERTNMVTKGGAQISDMSPGIVGISAIHGGGSDGAIGHYYLDDVYIDNSWQRVEIGNNATYDNCTLKEIQPATAWSNTSATFTVNQGSFADGATGYVFVTDASGVRNTGYQVTFGSGSSDTTAPGAPSGLSVS